MAQLSKNKTKESLHKYDNNRKYHQGTEPVVVDVFTLTWKKHKEKISVMFSWVDRRNAENAILQLSIGHFFPPVPTLRSTIATQGIQM